MQPKPFTNTVAGWRLDGVWVSLKQSAPPPTPPIITLYPDLAGSIDFANPIASTTALNGPNAPVNFAWRYFAFSSPSPWQPAQYWLFFTRSGAADNTNYYRAPGR